MPLKEIKEGKKCNLIEIQVNHYLFILTAEHKLMIFYLENILFFYKSSKPHTSAITHLTVNYRTNIIVCGSDDCSIFIYKIANESFKLNPIGMYPLPGKVTYIYWKPSEVKYF